MFVRIFCAGVGILFGGAFGFAAGGILSAIITGLLFMDMFHGPMQVVNAAFASHPWGVAAYCVVFGECGGAFIGAGLGVHLSTKIFWGLPPAIRARSGVAFGLFLAIFGTLSIVGLPEPIHLALYHDTTWGTVRRKYQSSIGWTEYEYTVNGQRFIRHGSAPSPDSLAVGDNVGVYFIPNESGTSSLKDPVSQVTMEVSSFTMISAFVSFWLIWMTYYLNGLRQIGAPKVN